MSQQAEPGRVLGVATLAGAVAGLVTGIGARIAMRIVALNAHLPLELTFGGTLIILLMAVLGGLVAAFILNVFFIAITEVARMKKYLPGHLLKGVLFGILLFLIIWLPTVLRPVSPDDDLALAPILGKILFSLLFIVYGFTLGIAEHVFDRYIPRGPSKPPVPPTTNALLRGH